MINIIYAALYMRAQTEKTTFSGKDDCTLMKPTRRWTYSALRYFFYLSYMVQPKYYNTNKTIFMGGVDTLRINLDHTLYHFLCEYITSTIFSKWHSVLLLIP